MGPAIAAGNILDQLAVVSERDTRGQWLEPVERVVGTPAVAVIRRALPLAMQQGDRVVPELLVQGDAELPSFEWSTEPRPIETRRQLAEAPALQPAKAFDHLQGVPGCPSLAVGVAVYSREAGNPPRRVGLLDLSANDETFRFIPFDTDMDVVTLQVVTDPSDGRALIAVLGRQSDGHWLRLDRIDDCRLVTALGSGAFEFDYRTPEVPLEYGGGQLPKTDGASLLAQPTQDFIRFVHYDGYAVRSATFARDGWSMSEHRVQVHAQRADNTIIARAEP